jgi:thioredoxin 1
VATVDLNEVTFEPTVTGDGIVLVDLWADWCGPCKMFGPIFEAVSEVHPDIVFGKVDTEAEQRLAGALGIRSIPTLMAFRDGVLVFEQAGALPEPALEQLIAAVQDLDMVEVNRKVEETQVAGSARVHR